MTEMSSAGIVLPKIKINKKLLNSLPKAWDMNVFVIKTTKNLNTMTLAETMAIIKASEMDGQRREINHVNSYADANIGTSTKSTFSAQPTMITKSPSCTPIGPSSSSGSIPLAPTQAPIQAAKGVEDNMALMVGFMNCYNAFVAGDLVPLVMMGELD